MAERLCWVCGETLATMIEDGVKRLMCPSCGPRGRRPRPKQRQVKRKGVVVIYRGRSGLV